ncbi:Oxidoreductase [Geobacillus stearothermophilus]|uniref:Oxidoreductase n=1 Tax=Geobacillus stearothermophilus TaxID=1422 RepID=A0ABQ7HDJ6_GEOSE|nr:Oxidoreductase [Geobacillus stearothermophilus]
MNRINVGIIGTGFSASSHIEALRRLPFVNIVAIASSSQEKAEEAARRFGIPKAYGDYRALIDDPDVEARAQLHAQRPPFPDQQGRARGRETFVVGEAARHGQRTVGGIKAARCTKRKP